MGWDGMGWDGMEWNGMEWNGMEGRKEGGVKGLFGITGELKNDNYFFVF